MTEQISTTLRGNGAPSVLVEDDVHASAGNAAIMRVHVRNLSDGPRDLSVTVIGLDDGWAPEPVVLRDIPADMTVSAEAALVPVVGAVPGEYPFVVVVQALPVGGSVGVVAGQVTTLVEAHVTVDAPSQVLLTVEPADSRMRLRRKLDVVLSNTGGEPVEVSLSTRTDKGLRLELSDRDLVVPARTTIRLTARARNLRPQFMGHLNRRAFSVAAAGKQAPARFSGTITSRPLLSSGLMRVMSLLLVMALWAGGLVVGLPWLTNRMTAEQTTAEETTAPGAGSDPGAAGDPADPSDPAGGSGTDGSGTGGTDQVVDPTIRIGGVVTATDPSGVHVQIAPASIIADSQGGGGGAGGLSSSVPVPLSAVLAAGLAGEKSDDAPLTKTSPKGVAIESTTSVATTRSTSTGDDGAWAFAGLSPNLNYLVTISKPGYQTVRHVVSGAEAEAGLDVELVAGDGQLSGRVMGPDGAGAGGVDIVITDGTTTVTTSTNTTGSVGSWSVDGLSTPSTYLVTAQGNGLGAQSRLVTLSAGASATADMALSNGVASLSGIVTGPDSLGFDSGVGGATVTASDGATTRTASTVTSGLVGSYTLVDLPIPGTYEIAVAADGFATQTLQLTLDAVTPTARQDVALRTANGAVQGRITDTAGQALTSAGITLHNDANTYKTMVTGDGSFRLNGIAPGEYVVSAAQFGHLTGYATVRASAGFATIVDLVLTEVEGDGLVSTSRIRGRVGDARTNGQLDCTGQAAGEQCLVTTTLTAQNLDGTQRLVSVTSDPNTEYLIPAAGEVGLLPGLYVLEMSAPGYEESTVRVSVPMDTTVTAGQVALYPSPSLTGTVIARVGSVPTGTCVIVVPAASSFPSATCADVSVGTTSICKIAAPAQCGLTGVNGGYTITNIKSGSYKATVQSGDTEYVFTDGESAISLVAGDVRRFDAVLNRLPRISLTTMISTGASALVPAGSAIVKAMLLKSDGTEEEVKRGTASAQGFAELTRLPEGKYRFDVVSAPADGSLVGKLAGVVLAYNQELSSQLVLTSDAKVFQGRLVALPAANEVVGIEDTMVTVTGITGYNGTVPIRTSVDVKTNSIGEFKTQRTTPGVGYLPVVADTVSVAFAGNDLYQAATFLDVPVAATVTQVELQPVGMAFKGSITLDGAEVSTANQLAGVSFEILSRPPGSGPVLIKAIGAPLTSLTGRLEWSDMTQPPDATGPGNARMARPGLYSIRASAPGYAPVETTFRLKPGGVLEGDDVTTAVFPTGELKLTLSKYGELRVATVTDVCPGQTDVTECAVLDPVITLRGLGAPRIGTAEPGNNFVDFGEVPPGKYTIGVQAAGFEVPFPEGKVTVDPGQTANGTPRKVVLQRLGSIEGTVTAAIGSGDQQLAGVQITAVGPGGTFKAVTDAVGKYTLVGTIPQPGLLAGSWTVTAALTGYEFTPVPVAVANGLPTNLPIKMTLTKVNLQVKVVQSFEDSGGIPGLSVRLDNGGVPLQPVCVTTPTDPRCTDQTPGVYYFDGVNPVQSTVQVLPSSGHTGVTVVLTPVLGQNPWLVTVPLVSTSNTVSGTVLQQNGGAAPVPLGGAAVTLTGPVPTAPVTTLADGRFTFTGLADGTYSVTSTLTGYGAVTRNVAVANGQVAMVDLVMFHETRQVSVVVSSDTDITGALVGLSAETPGLNPSSLAAQPLVRGPGITYLTVFNQVPTGSWTATITGAAGHLWSKTIAVPVLVAPPGDPSAVSVAATISEVKVVLSATAAPATLTDPLVLNVSGTPTGGSAIATLARSVRADQGTDTFFLLVGSYTVTPAPASGWLSAPASMAITAGQREAVGVFGLTRPPIDTVTTVTSAPAILTVGATAKFTMNVTAAGVTGVTGGVTLTLNGQSVGAGTYQLVDGTVTTGDITVTEAMVTRPSTALKAVYAGRPANAGSAELNGSDKTVSLSIAKLATSVTASAAPVVLGTPSVLTAVVAPLSAGTLTFSGAGLTPDCTVPVSTSATVTCSRTFAAAGEYSVTAIFTPTDAIKYGSSLPVTFTVTVTAGS
ncbi:Carboxypeptidase regulatory-like domain-containing protein [Sanguibacter gelidistatuariae]|uniref:Carboxypeptidase regulatory-like domain-containing protein n=1 Tax=Sanguibacter gelidistatuariae TaxID=1814289 RepID=A0A1G6MX78_9MICO|nr:carboxypeptidase regulatory-like domain-containing protein [Sanguibacter gelidistatuariae]SDC59807.1 Carboxypeptidase regulatory-like domain-containing protein [Sanguibacter gelidistatuariae]